MPALAGPRRFCPTAIVPVPRCFGRQRRAAKAVGRALTMSKARTFGTSHRCGLCRSASCRLSRLRQTHPLCRSANALNNVSAMVGRIDPGQCVGCPAQPRRCPILQTVPYYSLTLSDKCSRSPSGWSQQAVKFFLANRVALACAFFEAGSI
jgi:hypothetical protein